MPTINEQRGPSSPAPMRRRRRHPVRNTLIVLVLLIVGSCIFLFGINKWRIDFRLIGDSTVVSECGTPYKDDGAEAEVTGSILDFIHHPIPVTVSTENVNIHEPGTYTVTYTTKYLWMSATSTRTVEIVDTTPPVIELKHIDDYYTLPHHEYVEEGFTATDTDNGVCIRRKRKGGFGNIFNGNGVYGFISY